MKTRIFKSILTLALLFVVLPIIGQDALVVFFNDGNFRKFYLRDIVSISTSQYDEDGVAHNDYQFQHITTTSKEFVYELSNINCIGFSKYDEAKAEQNFVEAMPEVFKTLSDCETISDAEAQVEQLKNKKGVEDAWSDGHQLYVMIEDGETFSFHFSHQINDNGMKTEDYQDFAKSLLSKVKKSVTSGNSNLKVAIVDQEYNDEKMGNDRIKYHEPLINALTECGIYPNIISPTVDFFYNNSSDPKNLHIYDFDVVLLFTHGLFFQPAHLIEKKWWQIFSADEFELYDQTLHGLLTSDEIVVFPNDLNNKEPILNDYYSEFKSWRDRSKYKGIPEDCLNYTFHDEIRNGIKYWILYPVLTESFFKDYAIGKFPDNSVLYISACQSLKGDTPEQSNSFADILFGKNLAIYLGYTETDCLGYWVLPQLFKYTIDTGYSLEKAYNLLPEYRRHETLVNFHNSGYYSEQDITYLWHNGMPHDAELKILPEESDEAKSYFFFRVYTNESDQDKVNQEYSQNQTVTVEGITTHLNATVKDLHYGFKYKEVDIGHNPLDSWNPVELWEEEAFVDASLVPMTINSDKGNRLFKATLTNLEPGKTYVYRAYTYDGLHFNYGEPCAFTLKRAEVSINTCPDDNHPHMIDLGLPSGTKWACCNVGADKPEDYGGYYAWGETTEKGSYTSSNYLDGKSTDYDIGKDISGTQYDAATANWGSSWVMPNKDQMDELNYCTSEWTTQNGVNGIRFTSPNGASIFFPAAGDRLRYDLRDDGSSGYYWSSTLHESQTSGAWGLDFNSGNVHPNYGSNRYFGHSVRPVMSDVVPVYPPLQLSQEQLSIDKGNSCTVEITSGCGEYDYNLSNEGFVSVSISGSTVTINALQAGQTTVTIVDTKSSQTATIEVTVTAPVQEYQDFQLEWTEMSIVKGCSFKDIISYGSRSFSVESSDPTVATVTLKPYDQVNVVAVNAGQAIITVTDTKTGQTGTIDVNVMWHDVPSYTSCPDDNHPHLIDLGLPSGTKWACCNVGASTPEGYGGYYAWGETKQKSRYNWVTYIHCDGSYNTYHPLGSSIAGIPYYDAATANWGTPWVIPSKAQCNELIKNCTAEFDYYDNGAKGCKLTGPNGASIYLPSAGYRDWGSLTNLDLFGNYWSSTPYTNYHPEPYSIYFPNYNGNVVISNDYYGYCGFSIRPVIKD